jgi:hypothetical protein
MRLRKKSRRELCRTRIFCASQMLSGGGGRRVLILGGAQSEPSSVA